MNVVFSRIKRPCDFIVGPPENPYLYRWYLIPKNRFLNIYLHKFLRSDYDRALHDHPWYSMSLLIKGSYNEVTEKGVKYAEAPGVIFRNPTSPHRIELIDNKVAWTIFITGPKLRTWGFYCPTGWKEYKDVVQIGPHGHETTRGCD